MGEERCSTDYHHLSLIAYLQFISILFWREFLQMAAPIPRKTNSNTSLQSKTCPHTHHKLVKIAAHAVGLHLSLCCHHLLLGLFSEIFLSCQSAATGQMVLKRGYLDECSRQLPGGCQVLTSIRSNSPKWGCWLLLKKAWRVQVMSSISKVSCFIIFLYNDWCQHLFDTRYFRLA
jgi:hypothetical protein